MIKITRKQVRQLKTVFRRALGLTSRSMSTPVIFEADKDKLSVRARLYTAAVEYDSLGEHDTDSMIVPFQLLADAEGSKNEDVTLELDGTNRALASWQDAGIPQLVQYDLPEARAVPSFPETPDRFQENPAELLQGLHDAMETTDPDPARYATDTIQLRGSDGDIAATDGHQLFRQSGIGFPWSEDLLILRTTVFGSKDLPRDQPVMIGKTDKFVALQIGPWTFHVRIEPERRFPKINDHIPKAEAARAKMLISPKDADFLVTALQRLPGDEPFRGVTVDLNGSIAIRAKTENQKAPTELVLSTSSAEGEPIRFNTDRRYLARAINLGFREVYIYGNETPVACKDESRDYVWALLTKDDAIKPSKNAIRIESPTGSETNNHAKPKKQRDRNTMPRTNSTQNGTTSGNGHAENIGTDALIEKAEAVKAALRDTVETTNELIAALKQHKKTTKTMRSALASLRQLQTLDA